MTEHNTAPSDIKPGIEQQELGQASLSRLSLGNDGAYELVVPDGWHKDVMCCMHAFFKKGQFCDITVKVGFKEIHCHRLVLSASIPYFHNMFLADMVETRQGEVHIQDALIEDTSLESIVNFAYSGRLCITPSSVQSLLYAACILRVDSIVRTCSEFMLSKLEPGNCLGVHAFAEAHHLQGLIKAADTFACEHFGAISMLNEFLETSPVHLVALLSSSDLCVSSEVEVYEGAMRWLHHNPQHHKDWLTTIMEQVRLPLLPLEYLMQAPFSEELLRGQMRCRDFLDEAKNYHLLLQHHQSMTGFEYSIRTTQRKSAAGALCCVGGRGTLGDPFRSVECYDPLRNRWFLAPEMNSRRRHVGVISVGGKVYAVGGHDGNEHLTSMEVFDPEVNKWVFKAPMETRRRGIALATLATGPIYAIGGLDDSTCYSMVERYDIAADDWSTVFPMNVHRGGVGAAALWSHIYAVGGNDGQKTLSSVEQYDPLLDKWTFVREMKKNRAGAGVTVLNGCLYAIGGFDDHFPLSSVERYDARSNEWADVEALSIPRGGVAVASLMGRIVAVGGHNGRSYLQTAEAFEPRANRWEPLGTIAECRAGAGLTLCCCSVDKIHELSPASGGVVECM
uniref:kelch-like protein 8 n=2 Tax=Myxine glutinosa TaxID=7769 RepID=UPI00358F94B4